MHAKPDLRVVLKWMIAGSGSVITDVMPPENFMNMDSVAIGKQIIALKNQVVDGFNDSHWRELGLMTGFQDRVNNHPRLLRSLSWGDEDYEGLALEFLQQMVNADPANLGVITEFVQSKCPEAGEFISSEDNNLRRIVFTPLVFDVPQGSVDYNLVSAMMPFSGGFSPVYDSIKNASAQNGFDCKRADDIWDNSTVIQDVFSLIFASYIVVCDFTGKNPNVFYEAGVAHTLGKHVIPITQSADDIPFDLRHHRYLAYLNNAEGRAELQQKLAERIATLASRRRSLPWA